ncbi:major capsid protein [Chelatococcus daeguensis]|uniref:Phage major capsid protein E n=1 Tax=Chelatococcus sambhunathii TaxID=363953 RepID=A0ABP2A8T6_9HYPH|nr:MULTISPECIES: major capsid protein [Chelatococcus]KZE34106.1 major capsid protein E [Chelatococcus daeguensis]MBM3082663.1 major capsid protein [Chelatococcus daeguensis]CUA90909.1 Phage major capsid protein E [Chelatococcus sambhunathii]
MLTMDVFNDSAFSGISLTAALDKFDYVPGYLGSIRGLFTPTPVRTTAIWIEERANAPALIQTSPRGAEPKQKGGDQRKARAFNTVRLAEASRITADELQNIRAFGSETELKTMQVEVARRQLKIMQDFDLTFENMRLGAILGKTVDADGSVIYDWETEFGQTVPAEIDFDLDNANPASGVIRKKCNQVRRSMLKALKGLGGSRVEIHAICGDAFWDDFVNHPEVIKTFEGWSAAASLREGHGGAYTSFNYGDITWHNYRGTDDDTTLGVGSDKVRFFPVNAGIFPVAQAPAETFDFVNTLGQPFYSWIIRDEKRNAWADVEVYSYPLHICTMPSALHRGRRT